MNDGHTPITPPESIRIAYNQALSAAPLRKNTRVSPKLLISTRYIQAQIKTALSVSARTRKATYRFGQAQPQATNVSTYIALNPPRVASRGCVSQLLI